MQGKDGNWVINERKQPAFKCTECDFATWETDSLKANVMPIFVKDENTADGDGIDYSNPLKVQ